MEPCCPPPRRKAFTLIELLVVIAIVAILAAILFPVFAQAKEAGKKTVELSHFKQIGTAVQMYLTDHDERYMMANSGRGDYLCWGCGPPDRVPGMVLMPYVKSTQIFLGQKDPWTEAMRIEDQVRREDYGADGVVTEDERLYALMVRSNAGYNYAYFSPFRLYEDASTESGYMASSASVSASEVGQPSSTLLFATTTWYRDEAGNPTGGGHWVVDPPCWKSPNGSLLRPMTQYSWDEGDHSLYIGWTSWIIPNEFSGGYDAWLVYGGMWPFWNQKDLSSIQHGLKDGQVVTVMADSRAKARPIRRLVDGCDAYGTYQSGIVTDPDKFLWDLD